MLELKTAFFCLVASLLMAYAIGHLLFSFMQRGETRNMTRFFYKLVLGTLVGTTVYASVQTDGESYLVGIIPLLGLLGWQTKVSVKLFRNNLQKTESIYFGVLLLTALTVLYIRYEQIVPYSVHTDFSFYAAVGSYLRNTGIEAVNLDWINPELQPPLVYHYGEIWLSTALSSLFGVTILNGLMLIVYPLLTTLFFIGMMAFLSERLQLSTWKAGLYSLSIFCVTVFPLLLTKDFTLVGYGINGLESLNLQKFLPLCVAFVCCLLTDSVSRKVLIGCITALSFSSAAPGILAGTGAYLLVLLICKKYTVDTWVGWCGVSFTVLFIVLFYLFTAIPYPFHSEATSIFTVLANSLKQMEGIKTVFLSIVQRIIEIAVNTLPYLLLVFLFSKEQRTAFGEELKRQKILGYYILAGLAVSATTHTLIDSIQLLTAISLPLLLIFFVWTLAFSIQQLRGWRLVFPFLLIALNLYLNRGGTKREMDTSFNTELKLRMNENDRFAFVQSGRSLLGANIFLRNANYIPVLPDIRWFTDSYLPVNLSVYDIPYDLNNVQDATYVVHALENSPFLRYVEKNKLSKDIKEAQNRFIRENKIRFVVVQKGMDWFKDRPFQVDQIIPSNTENYDLYVISSK